MDQKRVLKTNLILWFYCKKAIFEDIIGKSSIISLAGGHMGSPLQRRKNAFNKDVDVGEPPCGLPQNNSRNDFLGNQSKKWFLQWNHSMHG
jgi:hypothetical protein